MASTSRLAAACIAAALGLSALPASAATFRWANDGDANSMDPYTRSETFLLTFTQNFYDPLVRRDKNLKVEPALAESWEQPNDTTWRFHLRHGVKFHDGTPFTADDVVFSYQRVVAPGSQLNGYMQAVTEREEGRRLSPSTSSPRCRTRSSWRRSPAGPSCPRPGARRTMPSRRWT